MPDPPVDDPTSPTGDGARGTAGDPPSLATSVTSATALSAKPARVKGFLPRPGVDVFQSIRAIVAARAEGAECVVDVSMLPALCRSDEDTSPGHQLGHDDSDDGGVCALAFVRLLEEALGPVGPTPRVTEQAEEARPRPSAPCVVVMRLDHPDVSVFLEHARLRAGSALRHQVAVPDDFLVAGERNQPFHLLDPATLETTRSVASLKLLDDVAQTIASVGEPDVVLVDRADDLRRAVDDAAGASAAGPVIGFARRSGWITAATDDGPAGPMLDTSTMVDFEPRAVEDVRQAFRELVRSGGVVLAPTRAQPEPMAVPTHTLQADDASAGGSFSSRAAATRHRVVQSWTHDIETACGRVYVTIHVDATGPVGLHAVRSKGSTCGNAHLEATGRLASLALRDGIEPEAIVDALRGVRCAEPLVTDQGVVYGCVDAIGRALERQFLGPDGPQHPVTKQAGLDGFAG